MNTDFSEDYISKTAEAGCYWNRRGHTCFGIAVDYEDEEENEDDLGLRQRCRTA
jgi:hypothetical protein